VLCVCVCVCVVCVVFVVVLCEERFCGGVVSWSLVCFCQWMCFHAVHVYVIVFVYIVTVYVDLCVACLY